MDRKPVIHRGLCTPQHWWGAGTVQRGVRTGLLVEMTAAASFRRERCVLSKRVEQERSAEGIPWVSSVTVTLPWLSSLGCALGGVGTLLAPHDQPHLPDGFTTFALDPLPFHLAAPGSTELSLHLGSRWGLSAAAPSPSSTPFSTMCASPCHTRTL